jgi:hypothetical protein
MPTTDTRVGAHRRAPLTAVPDSDASPPLPWPPPGLARLQGDAFGAARWLLAGGLLILPLLWAVVAEQDPWSPGPLGDALWLALLLGVVGIPILLAGYVALSRLLSRTVQALEQGHRWRVVALVAADGRRDTGFLLQGARLYEALFPSARARLAANRLRVAALLLGASLWLSLGFGLSIVLAARGFLDPTGVWVLTLAPSAAAAAVGALLYAWEERVLRRTRKRWHGRPWAADMVRGEVREWNEAMALRAPAIVGAPVGAAEPGDAAAGDGAPPGDLAPVSQAAGRQAPGRPTPADRPRAAVRAANVVLAAMTVVAFVPVFALIFSAAVLPMLARVSVPELETSHARYAALEPLRQYALDPDPAITAAEAGAILHTLSYVGRPYRASAGVLPPVRAYPEPWFPAEAGTGTGGPAGIDRTQAEWARVAVERTGEALDAGAVAYLERVAEHPARRELARLARAPALDLAGARWSMPLPSGLTMTQLSRPTLWSVRGAANAHLAAAALEAHQGRTARADTTVREVLTAGLLLADRAPTVMDNVVGIEMAEAAGRAMESLARNTGRPEAAAMEWSRRAAARTAERARAGSPDDDESRLRALPASVVDPDLFPGARWEYLSLLNTMSPCMNLRRIVFGPDAGYTAWLEEARAGLVRTPADAELFEVARSGLLAARPDATPSLTTRLLALTMGGADRPGSCARVVRRAGGLLSRTPP